jgi:hypothetical protein
MAEPILTYGSETWVHSQKEMNKIQKAEMRFLRKVKGSARLRRIHNEDIRAELNIYSINERISDFRNGKLSYTVYMQQYIYIYIVTY